MRIRIIENMSNANTGYMIVIALGNSKRFSAKTGWDTTFETRAEALACAARARRNDGWAAKVVKVAP